MVRPVFLIGVFVIFFGSFFSWLVFPHPIFIHLLVVVKLINLLLIFLGGYFVFVYLMNV